MNSITIRNNRLWFSESGPIPSPLTQLDFSGASTITHSSINLPEGIQEGDWVTIEAYEDGRVFCMRAQQDAHVDAFRKWENEWYGPQCVGPPNLGSGRCLNDELSEFYHKCELQAIIEREQGLEHEFMKAGLALEADKCDGYRLPAVNGDFVLTLQPHQEQ